MPRHTHWHTNKKSGSDIPKLLAYPDSNLTQPAGFLGYMRITVVTPAWCKRESTNHLLWMPAKSTRRAQFPLDGIFKCHGDIRVLEH